MSQSDFVSRGQALVAAGQFQEAVKVCRLGLLGRPTTVEGRVVLGQALLALKRFDEVLAEMRVALELDHTSLPAQVLRAEALLRKGDTAPAIEALHKARQVAPGDPRILQLLGEAENSAGGRPSMTHPAVGFVGSGDTKHYPGHTRGAPDDEDGGTENFTKPTSLQSPGGVRRSSQRSAAVEPTDITPPPAVLAVGDRSGTVEVDPESEGIELPGDPDFDAIAAPPVARGPQPAGGANRRGRNSDPGTIEGKRSGNPMKKRFPEKPPATMSLDVDEELEEVDDDDDGLDEDTGVANLEAPRRKPGKSAVRNAVGRPSGVIGDFSSPPGMNAGPGGLPGLGPPPGRGKGPTQPPPVRPGPGTVPPPVRPGPGTVPPPVRPGSSTVPPPPRPGSNTAPPPHMLQTMMSSQQAPPVPLPPAPRSPVVAALPTVAAAQPPPAFVQQQAPYPATPASLAAAQRPTMAVAAQPDMLSPAQQQSALAVEQLFGNEPAPAPGWPPGPDPRSMVAATEPTARPAELDPHILALMSGPPQQSAQMPPAMVAMDNIGLPQAPMKTGVRRTRSPLRVALWVLVGAAVIGGGVFAGFQIRAMRLEKQIAAARQHATDLAKADTWTAWVAARTSLSGIVQARSTLANRVALARARALIAFEFGDGVAEAKAAVEQLSGQSGLDVSIATAFEALGRGDVKDAKATSDAAVAGSDADPAAQYVAGHAALLAGNVKVAVAAMKLAADKEARPLYGIGLARAYAAAYNWEEAIAAIDRVLAGNADHPGASIVRANVLAASGRIFQGSALGNEVKQQLERIIIDGKKPAAEQKLGVSPTQVAHASLALARVELARGDQAAARRAVRGATDMNLDDPRFAEDTIETLYTLGELSLARTAGELALKQYPQSTRARIAYANVLVALGRSNEAIDILSKPDLASLADALAVRGAAYLAQGDTVSAATDLDAALKAMPTHEPAHVGRAWLELAVGEVEAATKRMAERRSPKGASPAVTTAYAATLRRSPDPAQRDEAKVLLEKVVAGPAGPDAVRAHLELARIYRDLGDFNAARVAYEKAGKNGSIEARLENALVLVDYSKPIPARELLEALLQEAGDRPSPQLVIEAARVRLLTGQHEEAATLLALADKMSGVERWKLDRERGRLALRKSDFAGAATALGRAIETAGGDVETFLLAADAATQAPGPLGDKVKQLAADRLKGVPEGDIVSGKLLLAAEKPAEAEQAFTAAHKKLRDLKAPYRRLAQADFGLAFVDYLNENKPKALNRFDLVTQEDPTLVDAYMFAAELTQAKDKKKAFAYVQSAVRFNPDYAAAWLVLGTLASELGDKATLTTAIARLTVIAPDGDELVELKKLKGR